MNKITIEPFGTNSSTIVKDAVATSRLINRFKKNTSYVDRFKTSKKPLQEQEEIIHFDDSFCFKEGNRPFTTSAKRELPLSQQKCFSQIMNVKIDQKVSGNQRKESCFELSGVKNHVKGNILQLHFDALQEPDREASQRQYNQTSYSSRRKYQTIKAQTHENLFSERKIRSKTYKLNQSTLIPRSPRAVEYQTPQKDKAKSNNYWEVSAIDPLKSGKSKQKKVNFFQYSIIKAEEIKSVSLYERQGERQLTEKRRKDQKALYLQMLNQLKKKEALVKRNTKMKEEIDMGNKKMGKKMLLRPQELSLPQRGMKKHQSMTEDKDEVKPWDVEPTSAQPHFTDMI